MVRQPGPACGSLADCAAATQAYGQLPTWSAGAGCAVPQSPNALSARKECANRRRTGDRSRAGAETRRGCSPGRGRMRGGHEDRVQPAALDDPRHGRASAAAREAQGGRLRWRRDPAVRRRARAFPKARASGLGPRPRLHDRDRAAGSGPQRDQPRGAEPCRRARSFPLGDRLLGGTRERAVVRAVPSAARGLLRDRPDRGREGARGRGPSPSGRACGRGRPRARDRAPEPLRVLLPQHHGRHQGARAAGRASELRRALRHLSRQHRGAGPGRA